MEIKGIAFTVFMTACAPIGLARITATGCDSCGDISAAVMVDFAGERGPVKPVNGVGQPPILGLDGTNMFHYLREAGIPYSRLHDVGGLFGKNVFVDIPNLFRDFDADENDPASYDFFYTDILLNALVANGVEPYFRLGVTIENAAGRGGKAYRIFPPKDYAKWARICEHVIRHYTEGWADGFRMRISHWEIWNEPENFETIEKNQMWKAPFEEYIRLYLTAASYLKDKFPHLKIGGYASCGFYAVASSWACPDEDPRQAFLMKSFTDFLSAVREAKAPLDFFSFHCYDRPVFAEKQIAYCRRTLDEYGFKDTEMSLNEWLPCNGGGDVAELDTPLQAAQIAAMLALMQNGPVDDAEIYDARATGGSFAPFFTPETHRPRKAYRVYRAFNELRKLGTAVAPPSLPEGLWACGATDGKNQSALMVANTSDATVALDFHTPGWEMTSFRDVLGEADAVAQVPSRIPPNSVWFIRFGRARKCVENMLGWISFDVPRVEATEECAEPGVKAVWIDGEPNCGKQTKFFAYYGVPECADASHPVPAMVLVHGGLGTAYASWVRTWVKRGYAAIAADNCGSIPRKDKKSKRGWIASGVGGPQGWGRTDLADRSPREQWPFHAVATVVRSHSFIRSLPEVDAERTGVTGISWGGFLTMLAAGTDCRFKFAAPVYACAYYEGTNCRRDCKDEQIWRKWHALWDPRPFVTQMKMPVVWAASPTDFFFPFDCLERGFDVLPQLPQMAIRVGMKHSHGPSGENVPEIFQMADNILKGGMDLPHVKSFSVANGRICAVFDLKGRKAKGYDLCWTASDGDWRTRKWEVRRTCASSDKFSAELPADARAAFVNLVLSEPTGESTYPEYVISSKAWLKR